MIDGAQLLTMLGAIGGAVVAAAYAIARYWIKDKHESDNRYEAKIAELEKRLHSASDVLIAQSQAQAKLIESQQEMIAVHQRLLLEKGVGHETD